jgi:FtsP/CotA-like multicopper oxidase with cupredoxin domain
MARIKEYWLQLESRPWDAAPWGLNRQTGRPLTRAAGGAFRPTAGEVLVLRHYTADWAAPDDRLLNPWDLTEPDPAGGAIPGAVITAKVADEIVVHYRNMDMRRGVHESDRVHSLHPHGIQRAAPYNGVFPLAPPDPAQSNRRADRLAPGESFTYRWSCPHKSSAGTWLYRDAAADARQSTATGAFGMLIIQAPGEQAPDAPPGPLRRAGDTAASFAAVPPPPKRADYLLVFHELPGVGLCLNGRAGLGNTPALVVGEGTRMTVRLLNAATQPMTIHIDGHRWEQGDHYTDVAFLPPHSGATLSILAGSAEGGGGPGEWLITGRMGDLVVKGSFVTTPGGAVQLPSA